MLFTENALKASDEQLLLINLAQFSAKLPAGDSGTYPRIRIDGGGNMLADHSDA
jgi:hypothetical protein